MKSQARRTNCSFQNQAFILTEIFTYDNLNKKRKGDKDMIGLGTWEAQINTMLFRGTGRVTISDVNGDYDFKFELVGEQLPKITVNDIEEDGDTLTAVGECEAFPGKEIPVSVTFNDDDTFLCVVKLPFVGKIKLNGNKIAD